jgi:hypothetical protein
LPKILAIIAETLGNKAAGPVPFTGGDDAMRIFTAFFLAALAGNLSVPPSQAQAPNRYAAPD